MYITIDGDDKNYIPHHIVVTGREDEESQKELNEIYVDDVLHGLTDICILENVKTAYDIIVIWIKSCKEHGMDTRVHSVKIKMHDETTWKTEYFAKEKLMRYPKLDCYDSEILYRRAILLQRIVTLFDNVLPFIVPDWQYSVGSFNDFKVIRELLLLSTKRNALINCFLKKTATSNNEDIPKLFINRQLAADHRAHPADDPLFKNSLFMQIYDGLKPKERSQKPLHYRWQSQSQWWECKFFCEGIIDQGGGFRDSICDISEELCPSSMDVQNILPLFIKSPNQVNFDSNMNRDGYIPHPSCKEFKLYEWVGQLMGGCIRSKESLILALPQFVWKKIAGENVSWERDYSTVNQAEVRNFDNMVRMDEESYDVFFKDELIWATTSSDGSIVEIRPGGVNQPVHYNDRLEYMDAVKEVQMNESNDQIAAIRKGLLSVIPQAVLDLFTWQEIEKKVCGDPEISIEALQVCTHYQDIEESSPLVKCFWEAIGRFSNEDRSRFLRFVTGRRRLPASIYINPSKAETTTDALPQAGTCSYTLYLPNYSSVDMAVQKLRYAAYNCVAIDTDTDSWGGE